jgi:hypothetical protein
MSFLSREKKVFIADLKVSAFRLFSPHQRIFIEQMADKSCRALKYRQLCHLHLWIWTPSWKVIEGSKKKSSKSLHLILGTR